jgi:hypothetical protein
MEYAECGDLYSKIKAQKGVPLKEEVSKYYYSRSFNLLTNLKALTSKFLIGSFKFV